MNNNTESSLGQTNYLVLDAIHTATTSFKKLKDILHFNKEQPVEDLIDEVVKHVEKLQNTKKSKSAHDLIAL